MTPAMLLPPLVWIIRVLAASFPFASGSLQPARNIRREGRCE